MANGPQRLPQNGLRCQPAMLATLGGYLALLLGLAILLLPLLATELSRPRDSVWGALVLLLGLVLVTTAERLSGAPMLGVLCGGLLIGRLGMEVGQGRWRLLSEEERLRLWSKERWQTSLSQASAALAQVLTQTGQASAGLASWLAERRQSRPASTKRWVRPEPDAASVPAGLEPAPSEGNGELPPTESPGAALPEAERTEAAPADQPPTRQAATAPAPDEPAVVEVSSFEEIDALIEAAPHQAAGLDSAEAIPDPASDATAPDSRPDQPRNEAG